MQFVLNWSVCLVLLCINVAATVLIVGPRMIRKNRDYTVIINNVLDENDNDCLLNVRLENSDHHYYPVEPILTQIVKVMANENKRVTFEIPTDMPAGTYKIVIEGKQPSTSAAVNIYQEVELNYNDQFLNAVGLIQLNKPVISPGETLKFRVIVVDDDLKPATLDETSVSVEVYDLKGNVIRQWLNVSLDSGIFENQIAIPTIPVLGTYLVQATANGHYLDAKTFEVRNYDIDSIDLNIYSTVVPLRDHQALNLTVDVKNYLGNPVRGNLTIVSVTANNEHNIISRAQTWDVNGIRRIYLPFNEQLETRFDAIILTVGVIFTEQYTNRMTIKEERINMYHSQYKVKTHNEILKHAPGTLFTAKLKVIHQNDKPAKQVTLLIVVEGANEVYRQNCTTNMNGEITFSMHTNESTELKRLEVYEGDRIIRVWRIETVDRANFHEDSYIKVEFLTRVKFNRMVRLLVTCSDHMNILLYYVISRGKIIEFGSFRLNQTTRYSFQLMMSDKLIPRSEIIVATILNKSLIHGTLDIFINDLGNPLEIKIEENIGEDGVDPGDEIELAIRGRPGAFVALAAYDQRLMRHGGNHDIFFSEVWKMFYMLHSPFHNLYEFMPILEIFAVSTDDLIRIPEYFVRRTRGIYPNAPRFGMPDPYRTDFLESWLWQNLTIPASGRFELVTTVPHSTTSWYITGISIDPKYGLGIVKMPITFSTHKIFFILDHLPHTIKRNETVSLHFTLFSKLKEEFKATVTMFNGKNEIQFIDHPAEDKNATKIVAVPPNSDAPVSFIVKAMKLGELEIRVNASIMQGVISDSFKKIIMVHPEDVMLLRSKRIHFDRDSQQSFDIPLFIDKNANHRFIPVDLIVYPDQDYLKIPRNNFNVILYYDSVEQSIHVNSHSFYRENITIKYIPGHARKLSVIVTGSGSDVFQINWRYRLNLMHFKPRFDLQLTKLPTSSKWMKELYICCRFIPEDRDDRSNGTFVEVSIPLGYAMESHSFLEETTINPITKIAILHGGTTMLVYFNHIGNETKCFSVYAYRRYKMRVKHPSYIKVQDAYRPEFNAVTKFDFH